MHVYRPEVMLQLQTLAAQVGAGFAAANASEAHVAIAKRAFVEATLQAYDVLLLDTAGRLHIDAEMMAEGKKLEAAPNPHERLFVVDSMAGHGAGQPPQAINYPPKPNRLSPAQGPRASSVARAQVGN